MYIINDIYLWCTQLSAIGWLWRLFEFELNLKRRVRIISANRILFKHISRHLKLSIQSVLLSNFRHEWLYNNTIAILFDNNGAHISLQVMTARILMDESKENHLSRIGLIGLFGSAELLRQPEWNVEYA